MKENAGKTCVMQEDGNESEILVDSGWGRRDL